MDNYFYEIWIYFGPRSRLVKPRLKICTFFKFLKIEFWKWIQLPIWPSSKVGQTRIEHMHFYRLSRNWHFKIDLHTHLRDKHGHLFLWELELVWSLFKVGKTKVENIHFCQLSRNWVLKVDLGTHLRHKHGHLFYEIWSYFSLCSSLVKPWVKISTFFNFIGIEFWNWI